MKLLQCSISIPELAKRSVSQLNQYAGFDTLGGMGLGKRSEPDQAGEKRALSTFDSLGGRCM